MKILIVDDEHMQRDLLKGFLEKKGYEVEQAENGGEALALFRRLPFQLVLLDHRMPDMNGDELLEKMKEANPLVKAIMITAYGDVDKAVRVLKLGALDFLEKPLDLAELLEKIRTVEQEVMIDEDVDDVARMIGDKEELPVKMVGNGPAMKEVLSLVRRTAPSPFNVLIRGETGTGKELVARLAHLLSPAAEGPFIVVNCGAIPEDLFESELFGHEKGSFTGASNRRRGKFELASEGTLFLDEIGELPPSLQPKLLRALQEKRITRVGGEKDIPVDVRILAATNRDLQSLVEQGRFREDLFYRLKVLEIEIPPLRQRKEDIPALVEFFVQRHSTRPVRFSPDAISTLLKYNFPGNVRELEHIIQRTVTLVRGSVVQIEDLPPEIRFYNAMETGALNERLEAVEREMIVAALEKHDWVQTRAAQFLGISERVLRYKMGKYEIKKRNGRG